MQLVDARGVVKNCQDGKRNLVTLRLYFYDPNSDNTLLAEDQIKCYGVKVYFCPRVFGGKQLIDARYQVGLQVKLGLCKLSMPTQKFRSMHRESSTTGYYLNLDHINIA